jgi:hypothetical protein
VFAKILLLPIAAQFALGVYLRLHIHERTLRPWAVRAHGFVGRSYPVLGWTQMLFGAIAFRGYCRGQELGQCLAHYIMVCEPRSAEEKGRLTFFFLFWDLTFRVAVSSRMASYWRSCFSWARGGFAKADEALTGGIRGSSCFGYVVASRLPAIQRFLS